MGERLASFLPLFVFCLLINGGPEEPAWRAFAMPRLQERFSPVKATLVFGPIWGLWHLPLLLAESNVDHDLATVPFLGMLLWTLAGFTAYAFTYTYVWNRTHSAFLCMVLHASYNTAIGVAILRPAGRARRQQLRRDQLRPDRHPLARRARVDRGNARPAGASCRHRRCLERAAGAAPVPHGPPSAARGADHVNRTRPRLACG